MPQEQPPKFNKLAEERISNLHKALKEGNYDQEFDRMFPPEESNPSPAKK